MINPLGILRLPYEVTRTPLAVVDSQLVQRLPRDSPSRLAFERILGSVDELAGRLLDDEGIRRRGTDLRGRAGKLDRARQLDRQAAEQRRKLTEARIRARAARATAEAKRDRAAAEEGTNADGARSE